MAVYEGLAPDEPWNWSRRDALGLLTSRQVAYCELLENLFRVKNAHGKVADYRMEAYQVVFHAHSPLAMPQAPDRLVEKGRGIGLTLMTAMDLLMLAHARPRVHIPVAGRQSGTSDEFIQKCWDLIEDCQIEGAFDADPELRSAVRLGNGSSIDPIPGGNPNALRSKRAPAAAYDEYAFHPRPAMVWRAGRAVLSEGGQLTVLSTHDGSQTHFYELVEQARHDRIRMLLFSFPIHSRDYDPSAPISTQVRSGRLKLIAAWLSHQVLDDMLAEDPLGYAQENLADVMDDALNLISRQTVDAATPEESAVWERAPTPAELAMEPLLAAVPGLTVPVRDPNSLNPVGVGVDFASEGDFAGYTAWEQSDAGPRQRWLLPLRGADTPTQNALLRLLDRTLKPTSVLIDMTGGGTGVTEHARRDLRCRVVGIKFSQTVKLAGTRVPGGRNDAEASSPIKKQLALHLDHALRSQGALLVPASHPHAALQRRHLTAVRRSDLDAPRKSGDGHADLFWASALALWGLHHGGAAPSVVKEGKRSLPRAYQPGDFYGAPNRGRPSRS